MVPFIGPEHTLRILHLTTECDIFDADLSLARDLADRAHVPLVEM